MKREIIKVFILLALVSSTASGSVIYNYEGNALTYTSPGGYFNIGTKIMGWIEVEEAFAADMAFQEVSLLSFSITLDQMTFTDQNAPNDGLWTRSYFGTDENGAIDLWDFRAMHDPILAGGNGYTETIVTYHNPSMDDSVDYSTRYECVADTVSTCNVGDVIDYGLNENQQGSWSAEVAVVPVPASAWLLLSGLLGLIGIARKH